MPLRRWAWAQTKNCKGHFARTRLRRSSVVIPGTAAWSEGDRWVRKRHRKHATARDLWMVGLALMKRLREILDGEEVAPRNKTNC